MVKEQVLKTIKKYNLINNGDKIVIGGLSGPIKTVVKIILLPKPMKEMRVKCEYERYDEISGAIGVKLFCPDLENALAGSPLFVYNTEEEALEVLKTKKTTIKLVDNGSGKYYHIKEYRADQTFVDEEGEYVSSRLIGFSEMDPKYLALDAEQ